MYFISFIKPHERKESKTKKKVKIKNTNKHAETSSISTTYKYGNHRGMNEVCVYHSDSISTLSTDDSIGIFIKQEKNPK
jgi:hypothetical protein